MTVYSHSRLSSFENCPRQFKYRYVDKIKVDTEGVEAFMGKRAHEILERLYHHIARNNRPPSLAQVLDRFRKDWALAWHDQIQIVRSENPPEFYLKRGERCLENYYRSNYPFEEGETVSIEERLLLSLDETGRYQAQGIVDRIVRRAPGHYEIHDYKSGGYLPKQARFDADRQLAMYQIGLEQTYDDVQEVELVWHYLFFNKTIRSSRTPEQLVSLKQDTVALIDSIEAESEFKTQPSQLCRWCDYNQICENARGVEKRDPSEETSSSTVLDAQTPVNETIEASLRQLSLLD
ncbi:MAG: PD-(D/E)XK nuclease family protein [bacterium]|nr:PD-(D/E)XK nuclease family protein [bacterium]